MTPGRDTLWHHLATDQVVELLGVRPTYGLTTAEVVRRQEEFGFNRITLPQPPSLFRKFAKQFSEPLMYLLLAAGAVTLLLRESLDAAVIFGVVLANALAGLFQESKAERILSSLSSLGIHRIKVRRNGEQHPVDVAELVPGDLVLLESGDRVPADLRLIQVHHLQVDESALSGESIPVWKKPDPLAPDTLLTDRRNLAYAGTWVTRGRAEGIVWAIGNATETGKIAQLIECAPDLATPLTRKLSQLSRKVLWMVLALSALTYLIGSIRGQDPRALFLTTVALAVAAIPEGLPAALTITLAIGVARMARHRTILRHLPTVETLGSTTVICSDKTGTLTENQMTVRNLYAGGRSYEVTGTGYRPEGQILREGRPVRLDEEIALRETLLAGLLSNDAQLLLEGDHWKIEGDPTEAALLVVASKAGWITAEQQKAHPRLDAIPFEPDQQFMATLHGRVQGRSRMIYKKGCLERLLERCTHALGPKGDRIELETTSIVEAANNLAKQGLRVLAFARREMPEGHEHLKQEHVRQGLTFLGLQGMWDPPRPEAAASVARCLQAGILVKMITGDHPLTAQCIARQLGLSGPELSPVTMTGRELDLIPNERMPEVAEQVTVFARVLPEQKLRLVQALQSKGHVVAMTGDGVNDAPALKQADIGIAMGINGTEVARGAADMVLADDNFATIATAVEEGRGVFDNLTKFILWTLPTNSGESLVLITAILLGTELPALPTHFLWINTTTALMLGMTLAFEPREPGLMCRPPRDPRKPILDLRLVIRTALVTLLILAGAFGAFLWEYQGRQRSLIEARTTVVHVIVAVETVYLLNCRSLYLSPFRLGLFSNRLLYLGIAGMWLLQVVFSQTTPMNRLFHTAPLDSLAWLYVATVGMLAFGMVELEKTLLSKTTKQLAEEQIKSGSDLSGVHNEHT